MTAYRFETLGGFTAALAPIRKECEAIWLDGQIPVIEVKKEYRGRSIPQNKLQRKWMNEAAAQGDCTAEEYRGYCKLHFGIAMLRNENEEFRQKYDVHLKHLPYETKYALMMEPFDFPVTRLMNTEQKKRYLDMVYTHFTGLGYKLTEPKKKGKRA